MSFRTLDESLHQEMGQKNKAQPGLKRSVSFTNVSIREYERILGDNPSVTSGPPIGIGWRHAPDLSLLSIDDYEMAKSEPRPSTEFLLDQPSREYMLEEHANISHQEMAAALKAIRKEKAQRLNTVVNLNMQKTEEKVEVARRKAQKMFNKTSSYEALEAKLWHDAHAIAAEKARKLQERIQQGQSVSIRDLYSVGTPSLNPRQRKREQPQGG
mmetsp:Transcript_44376/g.93197  ORF Transcript_44376/g.93197 Transcript_44376/m.93197 type:complete len:213 (+) Transcript_44376:1-639(+)